VSKCVRKRGNISTHERKKERKKERKNERWYKERIINKQNKDPFLCFLLYISFK